MIIVTIERKTFNKKTVKLAELRIEADGTATEGNVISYDGKLMAAPAFVHTAIEGKVKNHDRETNTVWNLVAKMLRNMGYVE
jgi:hypothetical protein